MKKAFRVIALLVLGAILGQVLLFGISILFLIHRVHNPSFLVRATLPSTAPDEMSNDELALWNKMRDEIERGHFAEVNRLITITNSDVGLKVLPAKPVFATGENVLAVIILKNISDHTLHVNEPKVRSLTLDVYDYQGLNQLDYMISISPMESSWIRILYPGQDISIPMIITARKKGPYKINYSLAVAQFNAQSEEDAPVIERATCSFNVQ